MEWRSETRDWEGACVCVCVCVGGGGGGGGGDLSLNLAVFLLPPQYTYEITWSITAQQ